MGFLGLPSSSYGIAIGLAGKYPNKDALILRREQMEQARQYRLAKIAEQDANKGEAAIDRIGKGLSADANKLNSKYQQPAIDLYHEFLADTYTKAPEYGGITNYLNSQTGRQATFDLQQKMKSIKYDNDALDKAVYMTIKGNKRFTPEFQAVYDDPDPKIFHAYLQEHDQKGHYRAGMGLMDWEDETKTLANLKPLLAGVAKDTPTGKTFGTGNDTYSEWQRTIDPKDAIPILEHYWDVTFDKPNSQFPDKDIFVEEKLPQVLKQDLSVKKNWVSGSGGNINFGGYGGNGAFSIDYVNPNKLKFNAIGVPENPTWNLTADAVKADGTPYDLKTFDGKVMNIITDDKGKATALEVAVPEYTKNTNRVDVKTMKVPAQNVYIKVDQDVVQDMYGRTKTTKEKVGVVLPGWEVEKKKPKNSNSKKAKAQIFTTSEINDLAKQYNTTPDKIKEHLLNVAKQQNQTVEFK